MKGKYLSFLLIVIVALVYSGCESINSPNSNSDTAVISTDASQAEAHSGTTVYVDDTNAGTGDGSSSNPFNTIQEGVDHAGAGETVVVAAGTYNEILLIDKPLSLLGPNHTISAVTGTRVSEATLTESMNISTTTGVTVNGFEFAGVDANSYTIYVYGDSEGFTFKNNRFINNTKVAIKTGLTTVTNDITIEGNLVDGVTGSNQSGIILGGISGVSSVSNNKVIDTAYGGILIDDADGLTISGNNIENIPQQGIQLAGIIGDVKIQNNTITNANTEQKGDKGAIRLYGSDFTGPVLITENNISGSHNGIAVKDGQDIDGKDINVTNNNITALTGGEGIYNGGIGTLIGVKNWWGDASGPSGEGSGTGSSVDENVDFSPWLCGPFEDNPAVSVDGSCDTTAPVVTIESPNDGDVVVGTVDVVGSVLDENLGQYNVSLYEAGADVNDSSLRLDEQTVYGGEVSSATLWSFDSSVYADGLYQIRLAARDLAGNTDLSTPEVGGDDSVHVIEIEIDNDPVQKNECKKGGWEDFGFKNQGQCVKYVNTGKDSRS